MNSFHSRPRLIAHVEENNPSCKLFVLSLPKLEVEEVAALDARDSEQARAYKRAGRTRVAGDLPTWRAAGPLAEDAYRLGIDWQNRLKTQSSHVYPLHV